MGLRKLVFLIVRREKAARSSRNEGWEGSDWMAKDYVGRFGDILQKMNRNLTSLSNGACVMPNG